MTEKTKDSIKSLIFILLFTFLNAYIPFLSIFVFFLWPLPVTFMFVKYGMTDTLKIIVIAALLNGLLLSPFMGLITIIGIGFIGFIIGGFLKEDFPPFYTLLASIGAGLFSQILVILISRYILGVDINILINELYNLIQENSDIVQYEEILKAQLEIIKDIYPSLVVISSVFTGSIHYYLSVWYLNKNKYNFKSFLPVKYWYFPRIVSIGIVITLLLKNYSFFNNLNVILLFLCFIQGFAVGLYYIEKRKTGKILKYVYIVSIFVIPLFPFILILVGLFDLWFNLRKMKKTDRDNT
ncbi:MAG: DUF2232 domain-containing protein [Halanaerobiales bacterium]